MQIQSNIDVNGALDITRGTIDLNPGNITIKSTALNTARVAPVSGAITYGTGNAFIVERNVAALRSWRLLTAPVVTTQTIQQAWMENAAPSTTVPLVNPNPVPNYGLHISGPSPVVNGFDVTPLNNYSIKKYNGVADTWIGTGITPATTTITSEQGWMLFIRGDRSYPISTTTSGIAPQPTTLRTRGQLKIGTQPVINPLGYTVVGNPYASAVNFRNVTKTGTDIYYIWDPKLATAGNTVGGWVTCSWNAGLGRYDQAPAPISPIDNLTGRIESGAAIVVNSANITSLNFKEADKATGSNLVFRPTAPVMQSSLRTNLFVRSDDGALSLFDGVMHLFDQSFKNETNAEDAMKLTNFAENIAIGHSNTLIAIDKRKVPELNDTLFYNLSQLKARKYTLEFVAENLNLGMLEGYILDSYQNKKTILDKDGITKVNFSVENIPGSYAANRFKIVFKKAADFTTVNAARQDAAIAVNWSVTGEFNISHFEVERSLDGTAFSAIETKSSNGDNEGVNTYNIIDNKPTPGIYYYRIKAVTKMGGKAYSNVVKVKLMQTNSHIYVFPNPVTNGNIGLQLNNQPQGKYGVRLLNAAGQTLLNKQLNHGGGTATHQLVAPATAPGTYQLELTAPGKKMRVLKVVMQ